MLSEHKSKERVAHRDADEESVCVRESGSEGEWESGSERGRAASVVGRPRPNETPSQCCLTLSPLYRSSHTRARAVPPSLPPTPALCHSLHLSRSVGKSLPFNEPMRKPAVAVELCFFFFVFFLRLCVCVSGFGYGYRSGCA